MHEIAYWASFVNLLVTLCVNVYVSQTEIALKLKFS